MLIAMKTPGWLDIYPNTPKAIKEIDYKINDIMRVFLLLNCYE